MNTIIVGSRSFVVETHAAAEILRMAAAAHTEGDLEKASRLTRLAARVESGSVPAAVALQEAQPVSRAA